MEMTGLNVEREVVIEVAAVITDYDFNEYASFETVIKQPQMYLDNMDKWNREHHYKSGLTEKVPKGMLPDNAEYELMQLVRKHFPPTGEKPILAGNSIAQDRLFIDRYFKDFSKMLHYRMLDVSSWKIILRNKYNIEYKKKNQHRALDDIHESIDEMKFYLKHLDPNLKQS